MGRPRKDKAWIPPECFDTFKLDILETISLFSFFICNVCFKKCRCFRNTLAPLLHFLDLFKPRPNSWDVHRVESRGVFKACNNQNIPLLQGLSKIFVLQRFSVVLHRLFDVTILLQQLDVVTILLHRIACNCYNVFAQGCNNGIFHCYACYNALLQALYQPLSCGLASTETDTATL